MRDLISTLVSSRETPWSTPSDWRFRAQALLVAKPRRALKRRWLGVLQGASRVPPICRGIIVIMSFLALILTGCDTQTPSPAEMKGVAMTIPYRLLVGQSLNAKQRREVEAIVADVFEEVDTHYNDWNPDSEISRLNQLEAGQSVRISEKLATLIRVTERLVLITEGRFDPTVSPLQKLWRAHLERHEVPPAPALAAVKASVGWDKIHLVDDIFWKDHSLTRIDLGGIAKGYCVDLMLARLNAAGYGNLYFEWGGEIATTGQHPEGRPWSVFISALGDPSPENAVATLQMGKQAIATSGDYMQYWQAEGKVYFHIVNPLNLKPLEVKDQSIASVSVLGPDCTLADGLATALMMFDSAEEAKLWAQELQALEPELSVWIQTRSLAGGVAGG